MSDNKQSYKRFSKIVAGLVLYTFFLIAIFTANFSVLDFSDDVGKWGSVGDYFGGLLNPILAFLSFIALLYTLKLNQEELAETRKELARAAQAHEDSKKVMEEQLNTQALQQFDSLFATLLDQLNRKIEALYPEKIHLLEKELFLCQTPNLKKREQLRYDDDIASLFRFLYQILKYIDESSLNPNLQTRYSDIVKSFLPDPLLHMLVINFHHLPNETEFDQQYLQLLEKFKLLEHMSFYNSRFLDEEYAIEKSMSLLSAAFSYSPKTFAQNKAYNNFNQSYIFQNFNNYYSFDILLNKLLSNTKAYICSEERKPPHFIHYVYKSDVRVFVNYSFIFIYERHNMTLEKVIFNNKMLKDFRLEKNFLYVKTNTWYRLEISKVDTGLAILDIVHMGVLPLNL